MEKYPYIVVEGNIGSGKTSLVKMLTNEFSAHAIYEEFSDNPFLPKFYAEPEKHAFPLELSFLAERYHQLKKELNTRDLFHKNIISDYYFIKSLIFAEITLSEDEDRTLGIAVDGYLEMHDEHNKAIREGNASKERSSKSGLKEFADVLQGLWLSIRHEY